MSQVFLLYRLQQIDSQLDRAYARLREIEAAMKDERALREVEQQAEQADREVQKAAKVLGRSEQEVQAQRIKIEQTEATLYGGKVRNPKELQDLQNESSALKRFLSVLEDRQLEAMLTLEQTETDQASNQASLELIQADISARNIELLHEQETIQKDVERLAEERQAALQDIPPEELQIYEQLRKQRKGVAVAKVVDKTCSACGSTLSTGHHSAAHNPNQITRCATCGRILYLG
jgi:predicted  nucleic acid-binding Zn-ribbon protein